MLKTSEIPTSHFVSAVFLTFSGNCREALTFYQTCFGGTLQFEILEKELEGFLDKPVLSGSLTSDGLVIHGSDLVHNEGRILGNYMAICVNCANIRVRKELIQKLENKIREPFSYNYKEKLIEITDVFDVRWMLYADKQ